MLVRFFVWDLIILKFVVEIWDYAPRFHVNSSILLTWTESFRGSGQRIVRWWWGFHSIVLRLMFVGCRLGSFDEGGHFRVANRDGLSGRGGWVETDCRKAGRPATNSTASVSTDDNRDDTSCQGQQEIDWEEGCKSTKEITLILVSVAILVLSIVTAADVTSAEMIKCCISLDIS